MAISLLPKRRTTDTTAPTTANLVDGELAVNSVAKAIFLRVGSNIITIANYFSGAWADVTGKPQVIAGNGLTGGGLLDTDKTLTLGAPSNLSLISTNTVTSTSHNHAIELRDTTLRADTLAMTSYNTNGKGAYVGDVTVGGAFTTNGALFSANYNENRTFQLWAPYKGGTDIPELYLRATHTTSGGGGWTSMGRLWHSLNDGASSGLDADLLDGQEGAFYRNASNINSGILGVANGGTGVATLTGLVKANGTAAFTAASAGVDYVVPAGSISGNAGTATKLATSRTIALSGKATGTATAFDGSANISIPITALTVAAADVTTGVFNTGRLGTGTADNTKYLRGDGTWATVTVSAPANMVTTDTTQTISGSKTFSFSASGSEGGEFYMAKPVSGTALTSNVTVDVASNSFRIFGGNGSATTYGGIEFNVFASNGMVQGWHTGNLANPMTLDTTQTVSGSKTFSATAVFNRGTNTASGIDDFGAVNGSYSMVFRARSGAGMNNPVPLANDSAIIFSGGSIETGALFIGPWTNSAYGIRLDGASKYTSFYGGVNFYGNTGSYQSAVGTQAVLHNYGWNNLVPRWKVAIESNASYSLYSYDTAGGNGTCSLNIASVPTSGVNIATFNGILKCGTGNGDKSFIPTDDAAIWDVNILHTLGIKSESDVNQGFVKFGAGPRLGYDGTPNNITIEGGLRSISSSAGLSYVSRAGGVTWTLYDPDGGGAALDESGVGTVVRFKASGSAINSPLTFNGSNNLYFGAQTRQHINLWNSSYGIGVQGNTQYFRTGNYFAWYKGGSHSDGVLDPGAGGTTLATLYDADVYRAFQVNGGIMSKGAGATFILQPRDGAAVEWQISAPTANSFRILRSGVGDLLTLDNGGNLSTISGIYAPYGLYDNGQRTWSRNTRPELDTYAQTIGDWNNALNFGVYMAAGAANQPLADGGWFIGIVTQHNAHWIQQEAWRFTDGPNARRYYRHNQNGTWSAWTSDRIVGVMNADRVSLGWDAGVTGSLSANNWVRLTGAVGLYLNDYGGGVWMNDTTYVRVYNGKSMYAQDFVSPSDERLKKDIKPFEEGRKYVLSDNAVRYAWRSDDREEYGFIAQTILPHYPEIIDEVVMEVEGEDGMMVSDPSGETRYVLNYHKAVPILAGELKSAREEISELRDRLDRIEKLLIQRNH